MSQKLLIIALLWCAVVARPVRAQYPTSLPSPPPPPTDVERRLSDIEQRLALQEKPPQPVVFSGQPGVACDVTCPPVRQDYWIFGFDAIPTQFQITREAFGHWPNDDGGFAARFNLAYEWADGVGIRAELWGFGEDASPPAADVEVSAGTFDLDIYKRLVFDRTEVVIGAGSRAAGLEFRLPDLGTRSEFNGGGPSIFGEWYQPIYVGEKCELAFVGRGRMSLAVGDWRDNTGTVVDHTNNDTMTLLEISSGLEFRRRFGRTQDKCWYFRITPELQKWDSPWMTDNLASSATFEGTDISVGLAW